MDQRIRQVINEGKTTLGIELGSTRIKSVLIDFEGNVLETGAYTWENRNENGLWTYRLEDAVAGVQASFAELSKNVSKAYGVEVRRVGAIGISGMMHGFLALDKEGKQLAPFLTWRNTNTEAAAEALTELFDFNVPLRWSISQLYQAILEQREFVNEIDYITTLAGYIHLKLSGKRVLGVGDASGMFPIDPETIDYDEKMLSSFSELIGPEDYKWNIRDIMPKVLVAGEEAGFLTEEGARLLDVSGKLEPGIPMAPPEGDAGTGMVATDSVAVRTGNVSAGTSIFAMVVLEKNLSRLYRKIDMVTTPGGHPVAMVHCNNGTSELDAWFRMLKGFLKTLGIETGDNDVYKAMFEASLKGKPDCDGVVGYNFLSGEPMVDMLDGVPLLLRNIGSELSFENFMRSQMYSIFASLALGMTILEDEQVKIDRLTGHGGLFKTTDAAQRFLAAAMKTPVTVMETAAEGGPYGMALLAAYMLNRLPEEALEQFLDRIVFAKSEGRTIAPTEEDIEGFERYLEKYRKNLEVERMAVISM